MPACLPFGIVVVSVDAFSNVKCSYSRCARKIEIIFLNFFFFISVFFHAYAECMQWRTCKEKRYIYELHFEAIKSKNEFNVNDYVYAY